MASGRGVVYTLAVVEAATGGWSLLAGGSGAGWAVAILYAAFAWFVALALRRGLPIASCGCFGKIDTPPSWVHLLLNGAGVAGGVWAAVTRSPSLLVVLDGQPWGGLLYLAFLAAGTYAAFLMLTALPRVIAAHPAGHL